MAQQNMMDLFKSIMMVQLFYAFCISLLIYAMPADSLNYVTSFSDITGEISLETIGSQVEDSLTQQTNIPVIEVGALVFYSGNIIIDLLLNFAFAIPQMLGLLVFGFSRIFPIDSYIINMVELFSGAVITILYLLGLMQLLTSIRSGRVI